MKKGTKIAVIIASLMIIAGTLVCLTAYFNVVKNIEDNNNIGINYIEKELEERIITKQSHGEYVYEDRVKYTHLSKAQCDSFLVENASDKSIYEYLHMHKERGV